ncbi:hypothetical protein GJAV_G00121020 [Gymnothorax javanicus]|nr:hypothetical protein GJAV_G00121020 [Gymnothorax javanicus]
MSQIHLSILHGESNLIGREWKQQTCPEVMRFTGPAFLLLLVCVSLTLAQGSYEDCCLKYVKIVPKKVKHLVVAYRRQQTDGGCNIRAIVFTLKRGRIFCADPGQSWTQILINRIDSRKHPKRRG